MVFFYLINECCCLKEWLSSLLVTSHILLSLICSINFVVRSVICLTSLCVGSQERVGAAEQACPFWCRQRTRLSVWWAAPSCSALGSLWEPQQAQLPVTGSSVLQLFIPEMFCGIFWRKLKVHLFKKQSVYIVNNETVIPVWKLTCEMATDLDFFICWSENAGNCVVQAVLNIFSLCTLSV